MSDAGTGSMAAREHPSSEAAPAVRAAALDAACPQAGVQGVVVDAGGGVEPDDATTVTVATATVVVPSRAQQPLSRAA